MKTIGKGLLWGFGVYLGIKIASAATITFAIDFSKLFRKENSHAKN